MGPSWTVTGLVLVRRAVSVRSAVAFPLAIEKFRVVYMLVASHLPAVVSHFGPQHLAHFHRYSSTQTNLARLRACYRVKSHRR